LLDALFLLRLRHAAHLKRKRKVLSHRHVREQGVVLEHHADAALVRRHVVDRIAAQIDLAVGGRLKTGQHHQAGGLARSRTAQHGQELALGDVKV
jgi:hypothetical protein